MLRAVVCPKCSEELDVPEELLGEPVRCASCATVFTPARTVAVPRRESADDEFDRPRRSRPPKPRLGAFTVVMLLLVGAVGFGCLGCCGLLGTAWFIDHPKMQVYKSPDGQFEAVFPGPPTPLPGEGKKFAGVGHSRRLLGQPFDACDVQFYDHPKPFESDRARDQALESAATSVLDANPALAKKSLTKLTIQGYPALELTAQGGEPDVALYSHVILAGKRVYLVTYSGNAGTLPPQSERLRAFWAGFRVLKTDAQPIDAGGKPKGPAKDPKPAPAIDD